MVSLDVGSQVWGDFTAMTNGVPLFRATRWQINESKEGEKRERMKGGWERKANAVWWLILFILALERLKQEKCHESEVSLGCLVNSRPAYLKKQRVTRKGKDIPIWSLVHTDSNLILQNYSGLLTWHVYKCIFHYNAMWLSWSTMPLFIDSTNLIIYNPINLQTSPRHPSICKSPSALIVLLLDSSPLPQYPACFQEDSPGPHCTDGFRCLPSWRH